MSSGRSIRQLFEAQIRVEVVMSKWVGFNFYFNYSQVSPRQSQRQTIHQDKVIVEFCGVWRSCHHPQHMEDKDILVLKAAVCTFRKGQTWLENQNECNSKTLHSLLRG